MKEIFKMVSKEGVGIDKVYFCPHSQSEKCDCRKPKTGMLQRGKFELNADLKNSFMIGDRTSDILAGKNIGCKTILVKTGSGGKDKRYDVEPDYIADNLLRAAQIIEGVCEN
jgi:D-glycero-D-manno-heptose 1,7-bisphosphate phosphatase